jgi:hypothetical protein
MKNILKQSAVCATISLLFVLAVFANRQLGLLGPENAGVALATAAVLPPAAEVAWNNGPILPPDPDIPAVKLSNGPILPPDPDIPVARLSNGPILPPDPDIPAAKLSNGPILPPDPDIPNRRA